MLRKEWKDVCGFATRRPAFVTPLPHPFVLPLHINWYAKAVGDDEVYHDNTQGVVDYLRSLVISARIGRDSIMASWLCRFAGTLVPRSNELRNI